MANQAIPKRETYVYALYREDGITPFYIGIGTNGRWLIHERDAHRGDSRKDRTILKMRSAGFANIPKQKLAEGLTRKEAAEMEVALIASIGRAPYGPLVNHTSGGDGAADLSEEVRAKKGARNRLSWADPIVHEKRSSGMRAVWTPEKRAEHAAKISEQKSTPESRALMSEQMVAAWRNPEFRAKQTARLSAPESIAARTKGGANFWADPEKRAKKVAKAVGRRHSQETKVKMKSSGKRHWDSAAPEEKSRRGRKAADTVNANPFLVEQRRKNMKDPNLRAKLDAGNARPEVRERRIAAQKAAFSTPEEFSRRSTASKAIWARRRLKTQYALPSENEQLSKL